MNKRIRKKKEKQQLAWTIRELVTETLRQEERRFASIQRIVDAYSVYYEQQRAAAGALTCPCPLRHGNVDNGLLHYGKRHSQHMEKQEQLSHVLQTAFPIAP